jgi:flagellar assembly protein FliH
MPETTPPPQPLSESEVPSEPPSDPLAEAFAQGEAAGRAAVEAEYETLGARQMALRQSFRALDQAAMDALANELAETVIALCAQVLSDYRPSPDALLARCQEAARRLGVGAGDAALHLHPDDLDILDESALEGWRVIADPGVGRGGVRFETPEGAVSDSPADWRRAIAAAIRG